MRDQVQNDSPWGQVRNIEYIADGIIFVSTDSHGGYYLSPSLNCRISPAFQSATFCQNGQRGWYEEDFDWVFVVYSLPEYFDSTKLIKATNLLRFHLPDALGATPEPL